MKKRFFSSMLLLAMIVTTVGMFVSCKDYDDDITDLRNQISSNATDLQSLVNEKITNVTAQITTLQSQATALESAYQTADANLKATLELEIAALQSEADYAQTTADAAYAAVQEAQAQIASLQGALDLVNTAIGVLQTSLADAQATITSQGETIESLLTADATLTEGLITAQSTADAAYTLAQNAYDLASTKADQADLDALSTTVETLYQNAVDLDDMITMVGSYAFEAYMQAEQNAIDIVAINSQLESLTASNAQALEDIATLKGNVSDLEAKIQANSADIAAQQKDIEDLQAEVAANAATAKAYADAIAAAAAQDLADAVDGINTSIDEVWDAYDAAYKELKEDISKLSTQIESVQNTLQGQITDLEDRISTLESTNYATQEEFDEHVKAMNDSIDALKTAIDNLSNIDNFTELVNQVSGSTETIKNIQNDILNINQYLANANKRLKSLVFAPTTYVDGIEAIMFATLQYEDWGEDLEADAAATGDTITIADENHVEEYLVNPKNISLDDIESFSFISNEATNTFTRSVSQDAPVAVVDGSAALKDGVLSLNLKKTGSGSFGKDGDKFTIVALKAVLSDNVKTKEEIDANEEIAIYSDWARLYETSVTPYIHNAIVGEGVDESGKLDEEGSDAAHFYTYSEIYGEGQTKENTVEVTDDHVVAEVVYSESLDLSTIAIVCDKDGNSYDLDQYGLAFEYNLIDFLEEVTVDEETDTINHSDYAQINGTILTSKVGEGEDAREAIDKTPVIQVILKDTNNGAVVDVKYLQIKWISDNKRNVDYYTPLAEFEGEFKCGDVAGNDTISVTDIEALYTKFDMTKEDFYALGYTFCTHLYDTKEKAGSATETDNYDVDLGELELQADSSYIWTGVQCGEVSEEEYKAGVKTIEAWGYVENTYGDRIVFSLTLDLTINQMEIINKDMTMWDESMARNVNPQIEDDAIYGTSQGYETTQLLGNLLNGYIYEENGIGKTPAEALEVLVDQTNVNSAKFVFDEDQLSSLPIVNDDDEWTISEDGQTLLYNGETAATIHDEGIIQLYESNNGLSGSEASEGAKLLVGKSVAVKLVAEYCALEAPLDYFNVNFLTPLKLGEGGTYPVEVADIQAGGSASIAIYGSVTIQEDAVINHRYVYSNDEDVDVTAGLKEWYGVETPYIDIDKATTNKNVLGGYDDECNTLLSSFENSDGSKKYRLEVDPDDEWKLIFYNASGDAIGRTFKVEVPITIKTKWQDAMEATVIITVNPSL